MHDGLVKKLGADVADALMDHLPPAGWSDLARRSDVDNLGVMLRAEMQGIESRVDAKLADLRTAVSDKITGQTRWLMASQLVLVGAVVGSITAVGH